MAGCSNNWKDNDEIKKEHEENDGNEDEFGMEFEEENINQLEDEDDDKNEPDFLEENTGKIWTFNCQIRDEQHLGEWCQEMGGILLAKEEKLTREFACPVQDCPFQAIFLKSHSLLYTRNVHTHGIEKANDEKASEKNIPDYVDNDGKLWPFCANIGKNISLEIFRKEFGFKRIQNRQKTMNLYCEKKNNKKKCQFSGIYSKENGFLYSRGKHDHPKIERNMVPNVGDDYVDHLGKTWQYKKDIGKNVPKEAFINKFGFNKIDTNQKTLNLYCLKNGPNWKCRYAGIYLKGNGCLYTRGKHEHCGKENST